jgi:coenzyme PQQ synthesis protein D (PqqD)
MARTRRSRDFLVARRRSLAAPRIAVSQFAAIAAESRFRRGADVVFQELDGEAVLVHLQRGTCFTLDPIGTRIWQLVGEGGDVGRMVAALTAEFDVEGSVAERDLRALLEELLDRELVVREAPGLE